MPHPVLHQGAVLGSVLASTLNQWRGCVVVKVATQPELPIVLYDMEACPYCRVVREAITALQAIGDPEFMLHGPATSTGGAGLMVIVNGPVAARLGRTRLIDNLLLR